MTRIKTGMITRWEVFQMGLLWLIFGLLIYAGFLFFHVRSWLTWLSPFQSALNATIGGFWVRSICNRRYLESLDRDTLDRRLIADSLRKIRMGL